MIVMDTGRTLKLPLLEFCFSNTEIKRLATNYVGFRGEARGRLLTKVPCGLSLQGSVTTYLCISTTRSAA